MTSVGLIGWGGIARDLVAALKGETGVRIVGALARPGRGDAARAALPGIEIVETLPQLLARRPAIVAEVAGQLKAAAKEGMSRLILPAGAIGGVDAIAAMRVAGLSAVRYRSVKPPVAWRGSPAEKVADLDKLKERTVLYTGNAGEAALLYPQNANVAATVALAGLGFDATTVELVADPAAPGNVHEIEVEGAAGKFAIRLQGKPSRSNPKTSALTAMSVARALVNEQAAIVI
jgi:aspartate dehydrogenase